jgi:hypothetical protein
VVPVPDPDDDTMPAPPPDADASEPSSDDGVAPMVLLLLDE